MAEHLCVPQKMGQNARTNKACKEAGYSKNKACSYSHMACQYLPKQKGVMACSYKRNNYCGNHDRNDGAVRIH